MNDENRKLIHKDLSGRIPYDTVLNVKGLGDVYLASVDWWEEVGVKDHSNTLYMFDDVKSYLKPLETITEKECLSLAKFVGAHVVVRHGEIYFTHVNENTPSNWDKVFDWLNANHFDYRGLIEKGLALPAPEGMYK